MTSPLFVSQGISGNEIMGLIRVQKVTSLNPGLRVAILAAYFHSFTQFLKKIATVNGNRLKLLPSTILILHSQVSYHISSNAEYSSQIPHCNYQFKFIFFQGHGNWVK